MGEVRNLLIKKLNSFQDVEDTSFFDIDFLTENKFRYLTFSYPTWYIKVLGVKHKA